MSGTPLAVSAVDYGGYITRSQGRLTEDEAFILTHVGQHGAAGYPVSKCGSHHWSWEYRGVSTPGVYKSKREAVRAFETHLELLADKLAGRVGTGKLGRMKKLLLHYTIEIAEQAADNPELTIRLRGNGRVRTSTGAVVPILNELKQTISDDIEQFYAGK